MKEEDNMKEEDTIKEPMESIGSQWGLAKPSAPSPNQGLPLWGRGREQQSQTCRGVYRVSHLQKKLSDKGDLSG